MPILKVYVRDDINISRNMVKYYGDDAPFTVNVTAGDEVTFEINGITATVVADGDGIAKIGINLTSGDSDYYHMEQYFNCKLYSS